MLIVELMGGNLIYSHLFELFGIGFFVFSFGAGEEWRVVIMYLHRVLLWWHQVVKKYLKLS